jgi:hypothetical protein
MVDELIRGLVGPLYYVHGNDRAIIGGDRLRQEGQALPRDGLRPELATDGELDGQLAGLLAADDPLTDAHGGHVGKPEIGLRLLAQRLDQLPFVLCGIRGFVGSHRFRSRCRVITPPALPADGGWLDCCACTKTGTPSGRLSAVAKGLGRKSSRLAAFGMASPSPYQELPRGMAVEPVASDVERNRNPGAILPINRIL